MSDTNTEPVYGDRTVSVSRRIAAPADAIFDILADPGRHPEIDGSGTVRAAATSGPTRLRLGSRFGMRMRLGLPYLTNNKVVEFEEGRLIAWAHFGKHRWRYELEPQGDGTATVVTETFDWTNALSGRYITAFGWPERNAKSMEATLARLARLAEVAEVAKGTSAPREQ